MERTAGRFADVGHGRLLRSTGHVGQHEPNRLSGGPAIHIARSQLEHVGVAHVRRLQGCVLSVEGLVSDLGSVYFCEGVTAIAVVHVQSEGLEIAAAKVGWLSPSEGEGRLGN